MFDGVFELIAGLLSKFYDFSNSYAISIALLTCAVMVITTPLTLKGTKSMIEMQRLQPEIRRLQVQYKDDRQKLNEEMMKFYREHEINPLGGCLPMIIQLPVFSILFWVIRGLTNKADFVGLQQAMSNFGFSPPPPQETFNPKYLDHSSSLYNALHSSTKMVSFGVDLAETPSEAIQQGLGTAWPYLLLLAIIGGLAWFQQKQIMGRNAGSEISQQQRMMMRLGPVMQLGFTFISPAALGIYFLVSTAWRVAQQTYITHSLYKGEDSVGAQAQRAMAEARAAKKTQGTKGAGNGARTKTPTAKTPTAKGSSNSGTSGNGSSGPANKQSSKTAAEGAGAGSVPAKSHPRSRKKKKRK
ncbi:MAG TPA: YidC/Oxa1 family membrane protein insertase [Acidimicrobiales bacterium]|jgi:YidC/Oxa1 family membrane protein insertase